MKRFNEVLMVENDELVKKYDDLMNALDQLPNSREKSLALTNLEQSALWAGAAERANNGRE